MSILWCGGEEIDFPVRSPGVVSSTTSLYRRTISRAALTMPTNGLQAKSPIFPGGAVSEVWLSGQLYITTGGTSLRQFGLMQSGTNAFIGMGLAASAGKIALIKHDGTTTTILASESGSTYTNSTLHRIDLYVNYAESGSAKVYLNGNLVIEYSGDVTVLSQTTLDQVFAASLGVSSIISGLSEVIVADEDTRLMSLRYLAPDGNGDNPAEWTNTYTAIDEPVLDDSDTVFTDSDDVTFQCALTGMPAGDFIVKAVKMSARAADGVGTLQLAIGVTTNSATHLGTPVTIGGAWNTLEYLVQNNPETTNIFSPDEINALQFAAYTSTP